MRCAMCGEEFTQEQGIQACQGCPISNCKLIKCPNCGYDNVPEPEHLKWLKRRFKNDSK